MNELQPSRGVVVWDNSILPFRTGRWRRGCGADPELCEYLQPYTIKGRFITRTIEYCRMPGPDGKYIWGVLCGK